MRFVNRQRGSGTRLLLELLLQSEGIAQGAITGYESAEFHACGSGGLCRQRHGRRQLRRRDGGARRFDLDFVPVLREQYFFACARKAPSTPTVAAALNVMTSDAFKATLAALPGYDGALCGTPLTVQSLF